MEAYIVGLIGSMGYFGMVLSMLLEAVIIIIPSELILATGGILVSQGIFTFWGAFLAGLLGSLFCAAIIYLMGYWGGRPFVEKYGKYFFMKKEDIEKSENWFKKYGMISALIGRNFPIVRTLISLPIGMARLSFIKFMIYSAIGSIPWTIGFIAAGYYLGDNWTIVMNYVEKLKYPIIILFVIGIGFFLYKKLIVKKPASSVEEDNI